MWRRAEPVAALVPAYRPEDRLTGARPLLGELLRDNLAWGSDVCLILADAYAEAAEAHRRTEEILLERGDCIPAIARAAEACERARDALRALAPIFAPVSPAPVAVASAERAACHARPVRPAPPEAWP
jgi:hypothetical protein